VHKKAKIWRTKRFPLFDSIQIIVDGIVATGENSFRVGTALQVLIGEVVPHMSEGDGNTSSDEDGRKSDDDKVCINYLWFASLHNVVFRMTRRRPPQKEKVANAPLLR
jgi:hypothetical protein